MNHVALAAHGETRLGIGLKIASARCMTLMSTSIKALNGSIPTGEVVFCRSAFALLPLLIWLAWQGPVRPMLHTKSIGGHVLRGISGSFGMFLNFMTLRYLPLADSVVLGYAAPMITLILAAVLLGERFRLVRTLGNIIGFSGVLLAAVPKVIEAHSGGTWSTDPAAAHNLTMGLLCGLTGAAFTAFSAVQIRNLTRTEKSGAIVFYFSLMTTILGASTIVSGWVMPDAKQAVLLVACGLLGGIGQILFAESLRHASASIIAPYEYTTLLWSTVLSIIIFSQLPGLSTIAGGLLIAASGALTLWWESRATRRATRFLDAHRPGAR